MKKITKLWLLAAMLLAVCGACSNDEPVIDQDGDGLESSSDSIDYGFRNYNIITRIDSATGKTLYVPACMDELPQDIQNQILRKNQGFMRGDGLCCCYLVETWILDGKREYYVECMLSSFAPPHRFIDYIEKMEQYEVLAAHRWFLRYPSEEQSE